MIGFNSKTFIIGLLILASYLFFAYKSISSGTLQNTYKAFYLQENIHVKKTKVDLFTAIFSYFTFNDRRTAIRTTWMDYCQKSSHSICKFVIDALDNEGKNISKKKIHKIEAEADLYKDLIILETFSGTNFAYRLYMLLKWVYDRYNFDFFLRIDDDQYLCFDRLLYELPYRKEQLLIWGHMHCIEGKNKTHKHCKEDKYVLSMFYMFDWVYYKLFFMCSLTSYMKKLHNAENSTSFNQRTQ